MITGLQLNTSHSDRLTEAERWPWSKEHKAGDISQFFCCIRACNVILCLLKNQFKLFSSQLFLVKGKKKKKKQPWLEDCTYLYQSWTLWKEAVKCDFFLTGEDKQQLTEVRKESALFKDLWFFYVLHFIFGRKQEIPWFWCLFFLNELLERIWHVNMCLFPWESKDSS